MHRPRVVQRSCKTLVQVLMEALEGCDNLRVLELGYNPFGPDGIKALADVMKYKLQVRVPFLIILF